MSLFLRGWIICGHILATIGFLATLQTAWLLMTTRRLDWLQVLVRFLAVGALLAIAVFFYWRAG
jgi:hypothetical protein